MRLSDRLVKQQEKEERRRAVRAVEEEEETMLYKERSRGVSLNTEQNIFRSMDENAINKRKSIFDRTALFHASKKDER